MAVSSADGNCVAAIFVKRTAVQASTHLLRPQQQCADTVCDHGMAIPPKIRIVLNCLIDSLMLLIESVYLLRNKGKTKVSCNSYFRLWIQICQISRSMWPAIREWSVQLSADGCAGQAIPSSCRRNGWIYAISKPVVAC